MSRRCRRRLWLSTFRWFRSLHKICNPFQRNYVRSTLFKGCSILMKKIIEHKLNYGLKAAITF